MNENVIIERLVNNIIDYTVQARERVYNNVDKKWSIIIGRRNFYITYPIVQTSGQFNNFALSLRN